MKKFGSFIISHDPASTLINTRYPRVVHAALTKEMIEVAKNSKQTSRRVAREASDALPDGRSVTRTKSLAGSALSQARLLKKRS